MPKAQTKASATKSNRSDPMPSRDGTGCETRSAASNTEVGNTATDDAERQATAEPPEGSQAPTTELTAEPSKPTRPANYLLLVNLVGLKDPIIERLLSLSPYLIFDRLHKVLQIAFDWTDSHAHDFKVILRDKKPIETTDNPVQLYLAPAQDIEKYGDDLKNHTVREDENTLADVYEKKEWKHSAEIIYAYGDGSHIWRHRLVLIGRTTPNANASYGFPDDAGIACLGGEGHGAAENVGGVDGWNRMKEAFLHPSKEANKDLVKWYEKGPKKGGCLNGDSMGLDPYKWSIGTVNSRLEALGKVEHNKPCESCGRGTWESKGH